MIELKASLCAAELVTELIGLTSEGRLRECNALDCHGSSETKCGNCCTMSIRAHMKRCDTCETPCKSLVTAMKRKGML